MNRKSVPPSDGRSDMSKRLCACLCNDIKNWVDIFPETKQMDVMQAIESTRHIWTEELIKSGKVPH